MTYSEEERLIHTIKRGVAQIERDQLARRRKYGKAAKKAQKSNPQQQERMDRHAG